MVNDTKVTTKLHLS